MIRRLSLLSALVVIFMMAAVGSVAAASSDTTNPNVIHTSGSGTVTGTPDRVLITFSVQTENADVKTAQGDNAARMTQIVNALVGTGISRDALKTTGYTITPVYEDSTGILTPKVRTYQVSNTLQLTLSDVSRAGEIIDLAVANGANQVSSIQFMLSDAQALALRGDALKKAVANARADADTVAGALGVNITGLETIDISQGYTPVVYANYQMDSLSAGKSAVPTPIQAGDVTVTAQVSITYTYH
jgi:uncharacterized protein